jgi:peptidoglycan/LPS O-acetylase OafA/YrhL
LKPERASRRDASLIRAYMPELDSVRGIAILAVVLFHGMARPLHAVSTFGTFLFSITQYGWVGVNLFFVLSGFLITGLLLDSKQRPDYFRHFYVRRALRILPALYSTLLVLLAGGWISYRYTAISLLFLANFAGLLGVKLGYGTLWSLAVEEHFYMIWPFVVRRCSLRRLAILAAVVALGSPVLRILLLVGKPDPQHFVFLYTWFNLDGLAMGALLAVWLRLPSFRRYQLARVAAPVTVTSGVVFFFLLGRPWAEATVLKSACNLGFAGFLACVLMIGTSDWKILVDRPILKFFGFISYGLYLVHLLAFHLTEVLLSRPLAALIASDKPLLAAFLRFGGGLALGTAIAYASRRSLEEVFLRIGRRSGRTPMVAADEAASLEAPARNNVPAQ